jgi:hypothetical protein
MVWNRKDDWVWKKFWRYTIIWEPYTVRKKNTWKRSALCRCDCWTEKVVALWHLASWAVKSCWCIKWKNKPFVWERYRMLEVIDIYDFKKKKWYEKIIRVRCNCGVEKDVYWSHFSNRVIYNCWCQWWVKVKYWSRYNHLYWSHKQMVKRRNLKSNLSLDNFKELVDWNCYYCWREDWRNILRFWKYKQYIYNYMWIDRIDPNKWYIEWNCVSCCKHCNYFKAELDIKEFKNNIIRLYNHIDSF